MNTFVTAFLFALSAAFAFAAPSAVSACKTADADCGGYSFSAAAQSDDITIYAFPQLAISIQADKLRERRAKPCEAFKSFDYACVPAATASEIADLFYKFFEQRFRQNFSSAPYSPEISAAKNPCRTAHLLI